MLFAKILCLSTRRLRMYCFCRSNGCKSNVFVGLAIVKACLALGFVRQCRSHSRTEQIEITFLELSPANIFFFNLVNASLPEKRAKQFSLKLVARQKCLWIPLKLFANKICCRFLTFVCLFYWKLFAIFLSVYLSIACFCVCI